MNLSIRGLNRATLDRQLLLERRAIDVVDAVAGVVGLQAQVPTDPYIGLWCRLAAYDPDAVGRLVLDRQLVRIVVMRATIHLLTADDCLTLRPLMQPVLDAELARHPQFGGAVLATELNEVLAFVRAQVAEQPLTQAQIRNEIAARFPAADAAALAYACRNFLPFVQVPPRGVWGQRGQVTSTTAEAWLGRPLAADPSIDVVMERYLRAFGPATVADATTWSRLTGLRAVFERLRPRLRTFRDEDGRELFDVPDGSLPDPDTPAPPRFLPEYDNVVLSHADRRRVIAPEVRARLSEGPIHGTVMHDGFVMATWSIERDRAADAGVITVRHAGPLSRSAREEIEAEGHALLRLLASNLGAHDVVFVAL